MPTGTQKSRAMMESTRPMELLPLPASCSATLFPLPFLATLPELHRNFARLSFFVGDRHFDGIPGPVVAQAG